jgi:hypothetical protein
MANKTLVEKAAEKVGYGLAMAEDVAGTVKTAIGSVADALKKSPAKNVAKKAVKKAAKKKPAKKAPKKSAAKKPQQREPRQRSPSPGRPRRTPQRNLDRAGNELKGAALRPLLQFCCGLVPRNQDSILNLRC